MNKIIVILLLSTTAYAQTYSFTSISPVTGYPSSNYNAFCGIAKDTAGIYHNICRRGTTHSGDAGVLIERTSSDLLTWSAETVIAQDLANSCGGATCDTRMGDGLGVAPDGSLSLFFCYYNFNTGTVTFVWNMRYTVTGGWSAKVQNTGAQVSGGFSPDLPYGRPFVMPNGTTFAKHFWVNASKSYLAFNCDNGAPDKWGTVGTCAVKYQLMTDSIGNGIGHPTEEEAFRCTSAGVCVDVARGCDSNSTSCSLIFTISVDSALTWKQARSTLPVSACTGTVNWNQVSPTLIGSLGGAFTVMFSERISAAGSSYCSNTRQLTFDPATLVPGQTVFPADQIVASETSGSPGYPDFGYVTAVMKSSNVIWFEWYTQFAPASVANLRSAFATVTLTPPYWSTIIAKNITDQKQSLITGQLCFVGTDNNDRIISFRVGGGGSPTTQKVCGPVTNGVLGFFTVPNPAYTSPSGIYYRVTTEYTSGTIVRTDRLVAIGGIGSFNWDQYSPSESPVSPAGLRFSDNETPAGLINGSNTVFTTLFNPSPTSSIEVFKNSAFMFNGWSIVGKYITFITAPQPGDTLRVFYRY